jgi:hypothetical protein
MNTLSDNGLRDDQRRSGMQLHMSAVNAAAEPQRHRCESQWMRLDVAERLQSRHCV